MKSITFLWVMFLLVSCAPGPQVPRDSESSCEEGYSCNHIEFEADAKGNVEVITPERPPAQICIDGPDCNPTESQQDPTRVGEPGEDVGASEENPDFDRSSDKNQGFFEGLGKAAGDLGRSIAKGIAGITGYEKNKKREIERKIRQAEGLANEAMRLQAEIQSRYKQLDNSAGYLGSVEFYSSQETQNQINDRGLSHNGEISKLKSKLSTLGTLPVVDQAANGGNVEGYVTPEKKKVERTRNYVTAARQQVESKFGPREREHRLEILDVAESATDLAEESYKSGDNVYGDEVLETARALADLALSSVPIVGGAYRVGNAVLGYNIITKEELSTDDRILEAAEGIFSLATGGLGSTAKGIFTASKIVKDISIQVAKKKAKKEGQGFLKREKEKIEKESREAKTEAEGMREDRLAAERGEKTPGAEAGKPLIDEGRQGKHIVGHNNYDDTLFRGILTADPNELATKAGTGQPIPGPPVGVPGSKERVDYGKVIGEYMSRDGSIRAETTIGIIHYSKSGIHIVPGGPKK